MRLTVNRATIILGEQTLDCLLDEGLGPNFGGTLSAPIQDGPSLEFWTEFEQTVNAVMLTRLDQLQREMFEYDFIVRLNGIELAGAEIDLQIYPSSLDVSFVAPAGTY